MSFTPYYLVPAANNPTNKDLIRYFTLLDTAMADSTNGLVDIPSTQTITGTKTMNAITLGGNLIANSKKLTGLAAGTTAGDSVRFEQNKVIQVVASSTTTVTTVNSNTNTDTNVSASITPTSSSNKVLVQISAPWRLTGTDLSNGCQARLKVAGSVVITAGNILAQVSGQANDQVFSLHYLHSPATTSATTYLINLSSNNASNTITMPISSLYTASIVLTEVAP